MPEDNQKMKDMFNNIPLNELEDIINNKSSDYAPDTIELAKSIYKKRAEEIGLNEEEKFVLTEQSHQYNAGNYLIKFQRQFYNGFIWSIIGSLVSIIGAFNGAIEPMYLGGGITFIGGIIILVSFKDIGNAGKELIK